MEPSSRDRPLRVRFAPSPARSLHVGAARTALFNWLVARAGGGAFVVRIEDTAGADPAGEAAILDDVRWLGIDWDEGPDAGGAFGPYRFSERGAVYDEHLRALVERGAAYEREGALWFRVPPGKTVVHDAIKGDVTFENDGIGDFVVRKSNGAASYHFAAAVDDATMRIELVLRGDEHLDNTPRQIMVARALGFAPPRYAHTGLVVNARKEKLEHDEEGACIADLRAEGYLAGAVRAHLAQLGWAPPEPLEAPASDDLVRAFSLARVGGSPAVFDVERLRARNAHALRALPHEELQALLASAMQRAGLLEDPAPDAARRWIDTFLEAFGGEVRTLREALLEVAALRSESVIVPALELERLRNRQVLFFLDAVSQYVDDQPELRGLPLREDLAAIASEFGLTKADALAAVRMALTGRHDGPPLALLFPLLGHDRIMIRIGAISSHILHGRGLEPIRYGPGGVPFETIAATPPGATAEDEGG
ncbi:MAG TPA: glutamate--tRNA ligase family protein [Candidatus Baltobacteraceae bacterium]|nr:glutamate--tRNA ligase family protein [Candidatus Baltobacteraceae bacterium]